MRCFRTMIGLGLAAGLLLGGCGGGGATPPQAADSTGGDATSPPAAAPTAEATVPEDVPILDTAGEVKVASGGNTISYVAAGTVEKATRFYQEQLLALGWEQKNKVDSGFGDSITLLRSKPDQNISVTIQSIPGQDNVRVLITLTPK